MFGIVPNLEKRKEEWRIENEPVGKAFGYPECCIKEFCEQPPALLKSRVPTRDDYKRFEASHIDGQYTGFIPCSRHAKEILAGIIALPSLIKNRDGNIGPFPHGYYKFINI
jgi:hypothetical protein